MDSKSQIYLAENCSTTLLIDRRLMSNEKVLYPTAGCEIKAFPKSTYGEATVSAVSEIFKPSIDQPTKAEFSISQMVKWDHPRGSPRITVDVLVDEKMRMNLTSTLFKPTVSITGAYTVSRTTELLEFEKFQISNIEMSTSKNLTQFAGPVKMHDSINAISLHNNVCTLKLMYSVVLEWEGIRIKRKRVKVLDRLYKDRLLADCSIMPSNLNAIRCHRSVVSATSDVIHSMLISGMEESQTNQIPMKHVSEEGVNALLRFFYEQEMELESLKTETVIELFKAAHEYNIPALEDEVVELLHTKQADCFELCAALDLYFFAVNVDGCDRICKKMLQIFKRNPTKLRSSDAFQELDHSDHMKATDLLFKVLELDSKD